MLTVTRKAAAILKAARAAEGASQDAGIRLQRRETTDGSKISVGFAFSDEPDPADEAFEQEGLRIFVEHVLVKRLDGRTLDAHEAVGKRKLVFR